VAIGGLLLTDSRFMPGRASEASGQAVSRV
jgi:hypothetical protein